MRTLRTIQTSFTSGELDPRLDARIEVSRYYSGAARARNVLVLPQGGIQRRPGLRHIATLPAAALSGVRLVPFAFSVTQTFLIALYNGGFQVFRGSDGTLLFTGTWPGTAAIASQVNWAQSADTLLLFHHDLPPHRIRREGADTSWSSAPVTFANIPAFDFGGGAEAMMSATRGWPECGTFHQGRLWLGGLKSRPATLIASRAGDYFNLQTGTMDDDALVVTIDSDQLNQIHQILSHRGLLIFTSGAEHAITVPPPITPTNVAVEEQSRRGVKRYARVGEVDGAILFVQRGGAALRQFVYSELEQVWQADLLSLLAPHLILDPRDAVVRKSATQDDADLALLPDPAGVTVLTTLRSQEVAAFTRWTTAGAVRGAAALQNGQTFLAVERAGAVRVLLLDPECLLDHALRFSFADPVSALTGLDHLEGQEVLLVLDGRPEGVATVTGGGVTLPRPCLTAEVGLGFEVLVRTMPIEPRDPTGALIGRKSRFVRVAVRAFDSGPFDVRGATLATRTVGSPPAPPLDVIPPPPPPLVRGEFVLDGVLGWHPQQSLEIVQPPARPAPLTVQALAMTVAVGG
jgi:hypothetical protein